MESSVIGDTKPAQLNAYVYGPGESELRWMGETATYFLATGDTTGGKFCLVDETARRGEAVPLHRHIADVESFYVIEGQVAFYLGGERSVLAGAGSFVHVPEGTVHGFRIESDRARYLILTTPHHGEFYKAISRPAKADGSAPDVPINTAAIGAAIEAYGIEWIGELPQEMN